MTFAVQLMCICTVLAGVPYWPLLASVVLRSCKRWCVLLSLGPLEVPTRVDPITPSHLLWLARQGALGPQTLCWGVPGVYPWGPGMCNQCHMSCTALQRLGHVSSGYWYSRVPAPDTSAAQLL
jgi:hypothetical protein